MLGKYRLNHVTAQISPAHLTCKMYGVLPTRLLYTYVLLLLIAVQLYVL
jgi:hypothetical protein